MYEFLTIFLVALVGVILFFGVKYLHAKYLKEEDVATALDEAEIVQHSEIKVQRVMFGCPQGLFVSTK